MDDAAVPTGAPADASAPADAGAPADASAPADAGAAADEDPTAAPPAPDWLTKPTLAGALVVLRPFTEADLPAMAGILADPQVRHLTGSVSSTLDAEEGEESREVLREWYATRAEADDRLDLAIVERDSGDVVGEIVLNEWEEPNASCNLRILLGPAGRDRGLGSEAVELVTAYAFEVLGLHRVSLEVYAFNPRAVRVYEKAGYVHESTRRHALRFDAEWVDAHVMAQLAPGWRGRRSPDGP